MKKNTIKLNEERLKNVIKETLKESVFGLNGNDLQSMGLRNPADDYQINYQDIKQKFTQFAQYLKEMKEYVDGVEEDVENNIAGTDGIKHTVSMRAMWSDDEEEKMFNDLLGNVLKLIWKLEYAVNDVLEETEYHN